MAAAMLVVPALASVAWSADIPSTATEAVVSAPAQADTLDLPGAVQAALASDPRIGAAQSGVAAGAARIDGAALRPPLELTGSVENAFGSGEFSGMSAAETTIGVSKVFEMGRKRAERIGVARSEYGALENEQEWVRLGVQADVTEVFVQGIALESTIAIVERGRELATGIVTAAERRVSTGRSSEAELSQARVAIAESQIRLLELASERRRLHRELMRLTGREPAGGLFRLIGSLETLPPLPTPAELESLLAAAPEARRAALSQDLARARLRLAEAQRSPDLSLSAGMRSLAATDDAALVFSASIPVGAARRARSSIAEAGAELARADALADAAELQVAANARNLLDALTLALRQLELQRTVVVPELRHAEELLGRGYSLGRFSFLEVVTAQRQSLEASAALIELTSQYHQTVIELGRLLGRLPLPEGIDP
ncbi:MAG: TolC family protein [Gammaproteobacteria bacterium]